MKQLIPVLLVLFTVNSIAIEEPDYTIVRDAEPFELRDYAARVVAEVVVEGELEDAGSAAFKMLFGYISGKNRAKEEIAMTAPVSQQQSGEKIPMTSPVTQQPDGANWTVSFMMPGDREIGSLPIPADDRVALRELPAQRMAVVRYSGTWSEARYRRHKADLERWMAENELQASGPPVWARYDAPFVPWFMRRNEILIPVDVGATPENTPPD